MENICINNGYFATKVKTSTQEFMFESKVTKAADKFETNLTLDGIDYRVGAGTSDLDLDKTNSITQKACINYAIKKASHEDVRVMSSLPVNTYSNIEARNAYKEWLLAQEKVKECEVYPEGAAAVISDLSWYKNKLVCLLDVGGLTINALIFDDGKMIPGTAFSMQLGSIIFENRIRMALQQNSLENIPEYQIKYLVEHPKAMDAAREYFREIKHELRKMDYPTNVAYRFVGGGALRYQILFKSNFKDSYLCQDAVWENVRGLYLLSEVIWK